MKPLLSNLKTVVLIHYGWKLTDELNSYWNLLKLESNTGLNVSISDEQNSISLVNYRLLSRVCYELNRRNENCPVMFSNMVELFSEFDPMNMPLKQ